MKRGQITVIEAQRVSGDLYNCTSPYSSLADALTWDGICSLAKSADTSEVRVTNSYSGPGELPHITYRPSRERPLSAMVRPSMATEAIVT